MRVQNPAVETDANFDPGIEMFGAEVRQLRKTRGMTLVELSTSSGISVSHISAIERGAVNPSLDKVARIAKSLSVPVTWFFATRPGEGPKERAYVVRSENRRNLMPLYDDKDTAETRTDWLLSSTIGGDFHVGLTEYKPNESGQRYNLVARSGDIHAVVIEGTLELFIEDEVITLNAGDSFSFPGEIPHSVQNMTDAPARLVWADSRVIRRKDIEVPNGGASNL